MRDIQALVQRQVRRSFVRRIGRFPETPTVATHIPVAQLIDKRLDRLARRLGIVVFERSRRSRNRLVRQCQRPTIDFRSVLWSDVLTKINGSTSAKNVVKAVLDGLTKLRNKEDIEALRGVEIEAVKRW